MNKYWHSMNDLNIWFTKIDEINPRIRLDRGQLDFSPSQNIRNEGVKQMLYSSFKYGSLEPGLKKSIISYFQEIRDINVDFNKNEFVITHGAIGGIFASLLALCHYGDHVLVQEPIWPAIPDIIFKIGAQPIPLSYRNQNDIENLSQNISSRITEKTKLIVLNSPHNPTGITLTNKQLTDIISITKDKNIHLIIDEAYINYPPDNDNCYSINSQQYNFGNVILIGSISKSYALPGLRIGYTMGPAKIINRIKTINKLMTGGVSLTNQAIAARAFDLDIEYSFELRNRIAKRRNFVNNMLRDRGFVVNDRIGSIYVFFKIPGITPDNIEKFSHTLLERDVSIVPGFLFGRNVIEWIRLALTTDIINLKNACLIIYKTARDYIG